MFLLDFTFPFFETKDGECPRNGKMPFLHRLLIRAEGHLVLTFTLPTK